MSNIYQKNILLTCFVEQRNEQGKWEKITGFKTEMYDPKSTIFSDEKYYNCETPLDIANDYILALLGNKKFCNDNKIIPIAESKYLPYNVSYDVDDYYYDFFKENKEYGASYLTAKEIMDYAHKDDMITITKYVTYEQYKKFKETGEVTEYRDLPIGIYNQIVNNDYFDNFPQYTKMLIYTPIKFEKTISELCPWLFNGCLEQLMARSLNGTGGDVRIIYWMDDYYSDVEELFLC